MYQADFYDDDNVDEDMDLDIKPKIKPEPSASASAAKQKLFDALAQEPETSWSSTGQLSLFRQVSTVSPHIIAENYESTQD